MADLTAEEGSSDETVPRIKFEHKNVRLEIQSLDKVLGNYIVRNDTPTGHRPGFMIRGDGIEFAREEMGASIVDAWR